MKAQNTLISFIEGFLLCILPYAIGYAIQALPNLTTGATLAVGVGILKVLYNVFVTKSV